MILEIEPDGGRIRGAVASGMGEKAAGGDAAQSSRVLCELLPKQAWSADEFLCWLRETQTRNART